MSTPQLQALARWLSAQRKAAEPLLIGINGAQGTGKSTLALHLQKLLAAHHSLRSLILSLDDLYLSRLQRIELAGRVHPLLRTRGVPGTHDVELGLQLLTRLKQPNGERQTVAIPRFIKALDDRAPESDWPVVEVPLDLILFEGWCVRTPPQNESELHQPANELEALEDAGAVWRRHVNDQLATRYAPLFSQIDKTIFLQAPDFDSIYRWRMEQEFMNAAEAGLGFVSDASEKVRAPFDPVPHEKRKTGRTMGPQELRRFVQHYERLTRHALEVMPERADVVIQLGTDHEILQMQFR